MLDYGAVMMFSSLSSEDYLLSKVWSDPEYCCHKYLDLDVLTSNCDEVVEHIHNFLFVVVSIVLNFTALNSCNCSPAVSAFL